MNTLTLMHLFVAIVLAVSLVTDLKSQRIYNAVTLPMWPIGILYHLLLSSEPWTFGLLGFAVAFPIHFLLWMSGLDKGGDAKLMIGVGACLGWRLMLESTVWAILLMLPVGLIFVVLKGRLPHFMRSVKYLVTMPYYVALKLDPGPKPEQTYIPKAPVLLVATVVAVFTQMLPL